MGSFCFVSRENNGLGYFVSMSYNQIHKAHKYMIDVRNVLLLAANLVVVD